MGKEKYVVKFTIEYNSILPRRFNDSSPLLLVLLFVAFLGDEKYRIVIRNKKASWVSYVMPLEGGRKEWFLGQKVIHFSSAPFPCPQEQQLVHYHTPVKRRS